MFCECCVGYNTAGVSDGVKEFDPLEGANRSKVISGTQRREGRVWGGACGNS